MRASRIPALALALSVGLGLALPPASAWAHSSELSRAPLRPGLERGNAPMGWRGASLASAAGPRRGAAGVYPNSLPPLKPMTGVLGIDVASYQKTVDWGAFARAGRRFAYVKATEGTSYRNPYFASQYGGAATAGLIRGAYHFANPAGASGKEQADFFVSNGGGWRRDGRTLPGVLDIEYNPYGSTCYGLSQSAMVAWIAGFVRQYKQRSGRDAVIYTTTDWWTRCTGNTTAFARTNPLWIARYASAPGTLPGTWRYYTFWQYSSTAIDQDKFSGRYARLRVLASNA